MDMTDPRPSQHDDTPQRPHHFPRTPILLGPDLWFDSATAAIVRQGQRVILTPREDAVLRLLLNPPSAWHNVNDLAARLRRRGQPHISAACIHQTICGLRRKLGESGTAPYILLSQYGHGYGC